MGLQRTCFFVSYMVMFCNAGRYAPLMELQRTCSFVSYMVVFCNAGRYAELLELERTLFCCVLPVQDVMLPSWNFAGLVLLCPVWSCFCSAGRYTPFINLQRTCFCVCAVFGHVLLVQDAILPPPPPHWTPKDLFFFMSYMFMFCIMRFMF